MGRDVPRLKLELSNRERSTMALLGVIGDQRGEEAG
jgi:hypothetical protein